MAAAFLAGRVAEWESRALEQHWNSHCSEESSAKVDDVQGSTGIGAKTILDNRQKPARERNSRGLAKEYVTASFPQDAEEDVFSGFLSLPNGTSRHRRNSVEVCRTELS